MKGILSLLMTIGFAAQAQTVKIEGKDPQKNPCYLEIESWTFTPGAPQEWYNLTAKVRSNFQLPGNPSLVLKVSHTPWTLYGQEKSNYDAMSMTLKPGPVVVSSIQSYVFQSWDEERKLVQTMCRFF